MRYCRFLLRGSTGDEAPCFGQVEEVNGEPAITALLTLPEAAVPLSNSNKYLDWKPLPLKVAKLLAPVVPSKIVCVGRNYREHASELGNEVPKEPLLFFKPNTSVIGPGDTIVRPTQSTFTSFEGELAAVIGRIAKNVPAASALDYVFGFTIANDVTARDLQKTDGQWARAKGFDTFCPLGPAIETEFAFDGARIVTRLNGEVKQDGPISDMIHSVADIIAYASAAFTLLPGDVILTGTPAGVGPFVAGADTAGEVT